jgi:hypothetical protein
VTGLQHCWVFDNAAIPGAPDDHAEMCGEPQVMRYIGDGQPLARPMAWRNPAMTLGHWTLRGYGPWAVEERGGQLRRRRDATNTPLRADDT